ncbi:MAG: substrate-binding domain-containing protein, partial [Brevinema sp.]
KSIKDLIQKDVKIIVNDGAGVSQTSGTGVWETIVGRLGNINDFAKFRQKIVAFVPNSGAGKAAFTDPKQGVDAWITWKDWAVSQELGEAVMIEKNLNTARPLDIVTKKSPSADVIKLTEFLVSSEAQKIFMKHGWYR